DGALIVALSQSLTAPTAEQLTTALEASPNVLYAEPDYRDFAYLTPGDSLYAQQWSLAAPAASAFGMNLEAAWDLTTGDPDLVVAVIDTGILPTHPDLVGRTVPGYDFVTDPVNAGDSDGRDADPTDPGDWTVDDQCGAGWDGGPSSWHGTHVAGIVSASADNAQGVTGVNWGSRVQALRVLGKCGGMSSDIADAIRWAAGVPVPGTPANPTPARVINLSLGGVRPCSTTYQTAIDAARAAGAVVVVAAGNSAMDTVYVTPANCVGVLTVGATDRSGNLASYSNFGTTLDLAAPGGDMTFWGDPDGILSTYNNGSTNAGTMSYDYLQGTSMAAPQVAGVASLVISANPFLSPDSVAAIL
ncbi:MAG TPA: S8 family peptidase, partial [Anaerolineales bacterium]|nr:S8 family peptidase [Anaerolineales bacterium]